MKKWPLNYDSVIGDGSNMSHVCSLNIIAIKFHVSISISSTTTVEDSLDGAKQIETLEKGKGVGRVSSHCVVCSLTLPSNNTSKAVSTHS